ncbi:hypothetical protein I312_106812 [Cryptococcus bacillisporus CA1280]|uniref:uncharacterized protein n=1 Tax=Cryptococcus bacillisporus CA1280 TaxID=1296109 RepID=UPI003368C872
MNSHLGLRWNHAQTAILSPTFQPSITSTKSSSVMSTPPSIPSVNRSIARSHVGLSSERENEGKLSMVLEAADMVIVLARGWLRNGHGLLTFLTYLLLFYRTLHPSHPLTKHQTPLAHCRASCHLLILTNT